MSFWSERKLSTTCRFVQGKAHEPFIEDDGEYICVTARFVSTNGKKYRRCTKNLTPGKVNDIAMVMSDLPNGRALARAFLVDQEDLYAINQRVCAITVVEGDPRFYFYQLNRNFQLLRYNDGINQTHLPNRAFTKLVLKVPPIEVQNQIADFLDRETARIDSLIEKKQRLVELLGEKWEATVTFTLTNGLNADVLTKDSGVPWIGAVPEHWKVAKLGHIGRSANGINIGGDAFGSGSPFVSYGDVYRNPQLPRSVEGLVQSTAEDRSRYTLKAGDILFTRTSETIDEIGFSSVCVEEMPDAVFAGFLIRFRPMKSKLIPLFSKFLFRNERLRAFFSKEMMIVTRASLSQGLLQRMPAVIPPLNEQQEISKYLQKVEDTFVSVSEKTKTSIDRLKEYRSALITSAVTGQIDVSTHSRSGTTDRQLDAIQSEMQA